MIDTLLKDEKTINQNMCFLMNYNEKYYYVYMYIIYNADT